MWIVWTDGWVEPVDMWMMVSILGWWPCGHHPRMVTIIHLSEAPNPRVGNSRLFHIYLYNQFHSFTFCCSCLILASSYDVIGHCLLPDLSTNQNAVLICSILNLHGPLNGPWSGPCEADFGRPLPKKRPSLQINSISCWMQHFPL